MFCQGCQKEAFEAFHKYECCVMEDLLISGSVHIALRIFFSSLSIFGGSIEKLKNFMEMADKEDKNFSIFDFDVRARNQKNFLKYFNTLSRSTRNFPTESHEKILKTHNEIGKLFDDHQDFIKDFLLRMCQTNDHYFHGVFGPRIGENRTNAYEDLQQPIASAWYPFHSLINHSCASNVMRIYVDQKIVLVACRFIPRGSQLFDCYKYYQIKDAKIQIA